jgi:hypothetical protein
VAVRGKHRDLGSRGTCWAEGRPVPSSSAHVVEVRGPSTEIVRRPSPMLDRFLWQIAWRSDGCAGWCGRRGMSWCPGQMVWGSRRCELMTAGSQNRSRHRQTPICCSWRSLVDVVGGGALTVQIAAVGTGNFSPESCRHRSTAYGRGQASVLRRCW